jgi:hypothetical protein
MNHTKTKNFTIAINCLIFSNEKPDFRFVSSFFYPNVLIMTQIMSRKTKMKFFIAKNLHSVKECKPAQFKLAKVRIFFAISVLTIKVLIIFGLLATPLYFSGFS